MSEKQRRLKLDPDSYRRLCLEILERDGWRCQSCGALSNLHVHHKQLRSLGGNDSDENLVTLCVNCHHSVHQNRVGPTNDIGQAGTTRRNSWRDREEGDNGAAR